MASEMDLPKVPMTLKVAQTVSLMADKKEQSMASVMALMMDLMKAQ